MESNNQVHKRQRKRHSKSRNGCVNCKKLRIKCDETRPTCQNCIRRHKECNYMNYMTNTISNGLQFTRQKSNQLLVNDPFTTTISYSSPILTITTDNANISSKFNSRYVKNSSFNFINDVDPLPLPPAPPPEDVLDRNPFMGPMPPVDNVKQQVVSGGIQQQQQPFDVHFQNQIPIGSIIRGTIVPSECNVQYQDLELIHHYSFHTDSIIMMQHISEKPVWDKTVPKVSFAYPYLLDALLALSGLHLQYLSNGNRDLRDYALQKYYNAMASSQVHDITTSFEPKFLTSCFLMMLAFSFDDIIDLISFEGKLDVFALARGPYILAQRLFPFLNKGPLSALLYKVPGKGNDFDKSMELKLPAYEKLLQVLRIIYQQSTTNNSYYNTPPPTGSPDHQNARLCPTPPSHSISSNSSCQSASDSATSVGSSIPTPSPLNSDDSLLEAMIYQTAIERLAAIVKASIYYNAPALLITWITLVSNDFMDLARKNNPLAKVVVAYYLAALYCCKDYFWIGDRPVREIYKIANSLPSEWDSLMSWPLKIIQNDSLTLSELYEQSMWAPDFNSDVNSI